MASIILEASLEIRSAIIHAVLIDVVVLLPVFFLEGVSGSFFQPLVISYALALLASMLVALAVTPALCMLLLSRAPLERRESPLLRWLQRGYSVALGRIIRTPYPAFITCHSLVLVGLLVLPFLGQSLFPSFKENDFLSTGSPNRALLTTKSCVSRTRVSRELRSIPGVQSFGSHIGRAVQGEEVSGINFAENWISIDPSVDYDKTLASVEKVRQQLSWGLPQCADYLNERIDEVLVGSSDDVVVRILGPDLDTLRNKAEEVRKTLARIDVPLMYILNSRLMCRMCRSR